MVPGTTDLPGNRNDFAIISGLITARARGPTRMVRSNPLARFLCCLGTYCQGKRFWSIWSAVTLSAVSTRCAVKM